MGGAGVNTFTPAASLMSSTITSGDSNDTFTLAGVKGSSLIRDEPLTPAKVKVSLESPEVMVLLISDAAGVKVLTPAPPTMEVLETPAEKSKLSLPAPPMMVEAVTASRLKSDTPVPPSRVEALVRAPT